MDILIYLIDDNPNIRTNTVEKLNIVFEEFNAFLLNKNEKQKLSIKAEPYDFADGYKKLNDDTNKPDLVLLDLENKARHFSILQGSSFINKILETKTLNSDKVELLNKLVLFTNNPKNEKDTFQREISTNNPTTLHIPSIQKSINMRNSDDRSVVASILFKKNKTLYNYFHEYFSNNKLAKFETIFSDTYNINLAHILYIQHDKIKIHNLLKRAHFIVNSRVIKCKHQADINGKGTISDTEKLVSVKSNLAEHKNIEKNEKQFLIRINKYIISTLHITEFEITKGIMIIRFGQGVEIATNKYPKEEGFEKRFQEYIQKSREYFINHYRIEEVSM